MLWIGRKSHYKPANKFVKPGDLQLGPLGTRFLDVTVSLKSGLSNLKKNEIREEQVKFA
jgi:hypothetical protein